VDLTLATGECEYPNGLAFSPDERTLYVAISRLDERCLAGASNGEVCRHRRIRAFDVDAQGRLSNNCVFIDMSSAEPGVPDGMKVTRDGYLFCTGSGGIWVIDPQGRRMGVIRVPEVPRNLAFGGPDMHTLYITAGKSLYSLPTKVMGIGVFFSYVKDGGAKSLPARHSFVYRNRDGNWLIVDHHSSAMPAPPK
jgi:gluconolactonase